MNVFQKLFVFAVLPFALCSHDLSSTYQFNLTLVEGNYWLHWNFNPTTQKIDFAVRVRTTGWIGFGLSPNGQMPGSDVVIGWIDGSNTYFHDRYAARRSTPSIDPIQNWFLRDAEEEDGFTILEFYRNFTSCDTTNDLDILYETSHVVYSWNDNKPTVGTGTDGNPSYDIMPHTMKGSTSVNLLGGLPNPPQITENTRPLIVNVNEITIPNDTDTTYWCKGMKLPTDILQDEKYIIKFSPYITEGNEAYVHHMLIFLCDGLVDADLGPGGHCYNRNFTSDRLRACTVSTYIGGWAVGGNDFYYPDNVALPIGGAGTFKFAVVQIHYDNPNFDSDVIDSSGMEFTYIDSPRQHKAGLFPFGHFVSSSLNIPPKAHNYTAFALCPSTCTKKYISDEGIHIFANFLHTHLAGSGLVLRHIRETDCGTDKRVQEMAPIDSNLKYDFNFQQTSHLPKEITVLPGDTLILDCIYNTENRTGVTFGGLSTHEEMCSSFLLYYPKIDDPMAVCNSAPVFNKIYEFLGQYVPDEKIAAFRNLNEQSTESEIAAAYNQLEWTQTQIDAFQRYIYGDSNQIVYCGEYVVSTFPPVCCGHESNNSCTGYQAGPCCQRECLDPRGLTVNGAGPLGSSVPLMMLATLLGIIAVFYYY